MGGGGREIIKKRSKEKQHGKMIKEKIGEIENLTCKLSIPGDIYHEN